MTLYIFSGPSWEEDSLNDFIQSDAKEIPKYSSPRLIKSLYEKPLPSLLFKNLEHSVRNN